MTPALSMHKPSHFKRTIVKINTHSWLFRMSAAPPEGFISNLQFIFLCQVLNESPQLQIVSCQVWRTGWPGMRISTNESTISTTPTQLLCDLQTKMWRSRRVVVTCLMWPYEQSLSKELVPCTVDGADTVLVCC